MVMLHIQQAIINDNEVWFKLQYCDLKDLKSNENIDHGDDGNN